MSLTPEEQRAIQKDITEGLGDIAKFLRGVSTTLPVAIDRLHTNSTSARKLRKALTHIIEAHQEINAALQIGISVDKDILKR